jgi:hypothetical protein
MYRDPYTGHYLTHYRVYDPHTARWLTHDPAGFADGLNLYAAYMGVNGVDPNGDALHIAGGALAGAIIGGGFYAFTTDDFSLKGLAKASGIGAVTGAAGAATFGASFAAAGAAGYGTVAASAMAGTISGVSAGALGGALETGTIEGTMQGAAYGGILGGAFSAAGPALGKMGASVLRNGGPRSRNLLARIHYLRRGNFGALNGLARRTKDYWDDSAGEWLGWREGFADTGRFNWGRMRRLYGRSGYAAPRQPVHHRIIAQGGTRGGAGRLSTRGFFREQYGRYVPNFIKNTKWNMRLVGGSGNRFTTAMHKQIHGATIAGERLNLAQKLWYGSNIYDKAAVIGGAGTLGGTAWYLSEE